MGAEADTIRISDEMNIDIVPDGPVNGIELLNANEQLQSADGGKFRVSRRSRKPRKWSYLSWRCDRRVTAAKTG